MTNARPRPKLRALTRQVLKFFKGADCTSAGCPAPELPWLCGDRVSYVLLPPPIPTQASLSPVPRGTPPLPAAPACGGQLLSPSLSWRAQSTHQRSRHLSAAHTATRTNGDMWRLCSSHACPATRICSKAPSELLHSSGGLPSRPHPALRAQHPEPLSAVLLPLSLSGWWPLRPESREGAHPQLPGGTSCQPALGWSLHPPPGVAPPPAIPPPTWLALTCRQVSTRPPQKVWHLLLCPFWCCTVPSPPPPALPPLGSCRTDHNHCLCLPQGFQGPSSSGESQVLLATKPPYSPELLEAVFLPLPALQTSKLSLC